MSKRRTPTNPPAQPASYKARPVDRSNRYTKLASSGTAPTSERSVPLNNVRRLIGSIRATVRHLELLLLGGVA